jgi:hypothetical protein
VERIIPLLNGKLVVALLKYPQLLFWLDGGKLGNTTTLLTLLLAHPPPE